MKNIVYSILLLISLFALGCSNSAQISGKVQLTDGTPITQGSVMFDSETHSYYGTINSDGTYTTASAKTQIIPPGTYKVWLSGTEITDNKYNEKGDLLSYTTTSLADVKYTSPTTTDWTLTISKAGPITHDISVEPYKKK